MNAPGLDLEYILRTILDLIMGVKLSDSLDFLSTVYSDIKIVGVLFSLFFVCVAIYAEMKLHEMHHEEHERLHHLLGHGHGDHGHGDEHGGGHGDSHDAHGEAVGQTNPRWEKIEDKINSTNASDWRVAILECDIILDEMLSKMGYHGETVSDKLKAIEPSDFRTLNSAWEAHKIRNAIAHAGSEFLISEREARRVIGLYEAVFKEFKFI